MKRFPSTVRMKKKEIYGMEVQGLRKYGLNESLTVCDSCGREKILKGRELISAKRTPVEVLTELGWKCDAEKDYCPHCVRRLFKQDETSVLPIFEKYENRIENKGKTKEELRRNYLMDLSQELQKIADQKELLKEDTLFCSNLYHLIRLLSSIDDTIS